MEKVLYELKRADGTTKLKVSQTGNQVRLTLKDKEGNRKSSILTPKQWNHMLARGSMAEL